WPFCFAAGGLLNWFGTNDRRRKVVFRFHFQCIFTLSLSRTAARHCSGVVSCFLPPHESHIQRRGSLAVCRDAAGATRAGGTRSGGWTRTRISAGAPVRGALHGFGGRMCAHVAHVPPGSSVDRGGVAERGLDPAAEGSEDGRRGGGGERGK